jgi:hypothetical protein
MTDFRAGGLVRETLDATTGQVRAGGLVREVLLGGKTVVLFAGVVRELLRTPEGPSAPQLRPWLRHDQFRDGDDAAEWSPSTRRPTIVTVPGGGLRRAWLRQHFVLEQLDEEAWLPPRHGIAPAIIAPQQKPWLRAHFLLDEFEDSAPLAAVMRHHATAPPIPPVVTSLSETLFIANVGRLMGRRG